MVSTGILLCITKPNMSSGCRLLAGFLFCRGRGEMEMAGMGEGWNWLLSLPSNQMV